MSSPLSILLELPRGRQGFALSVFSALSRAVGIVLIAEAVVRGIIGPAPLTTWVVLGLLGAGLRGAGLWADHSLGISLSARSKQRLRSGILGSLLRGRGRPRSNAAVTVTRGIDDLDDYFTTVVPALSAAAVVPIVLLARIVFSDVLSAVIIAVCLPLVPLFMILIGRYTAESTAETVTALERLSDHLAELAEGLPVLIGLGRSKDHARRLRELGESYHRANLSTLRIAFLSSLALELIATISVALVAVVIGLRLVSGSMDLSSGLFVLLMAPECFVPLRELGAGYHASENGREARDRAHALIAGAEASESDSTQAGQAAQIGETAQTGEVPAPAEDHVTYGDGTRIAWAGAIGSHPGVTAISGPSGIGKTTVLSALVGSLPAGAESTIEPLSAALVPQTPRMFAATIGEELDLFGLSRDRQASALHAARLPDDPLTSTAALSPGQLRRLAFVRIMHRLDSGASILVLDEPTAHLDDENALIIIAMIAEAAEHIRVILASHDERVHALADSEIRPQKTTTAKPTGEDRRAAPTGGHRTVEETATVDANGDSGQTRHTRVSHRADDGEDTRETDAGTVPDSDHAHDSVASAREPEHLREVPRKALRRRLSTLRSSMPLFTPSMLLALVTSCGSSLAGIALTAVSAWLIVEASYQPPIMLLMVAIVGVRFFGLSRSVLLYVSRLKLHSAIFASLGRLRSTLWSHFERVGMSDRKILTSDSALQTMVADADDVRDLVPRTLFPPVASGMVVVGVCITATLLDAGSLVWFIVLGALNLVFLPVVVIGTESALAGRIRRHRQAILSLLTRALGAKDDLRTNRADSGVLLLLEGVEDRLEAAQRASACNFGLAHLWLQLSTVSTALIIASTSSAPTEILAVLVLMAFGLNEVFASALGAYRQLPALGVALDRLPATDPDGERSAGRGSCQVAPVISGIREIDLDAITVGWDDETVLDGLDLHVDSDRWTVLRGDSGTGKSTTLSVLLRFLDPWSGRYTSADRTGRTVDMLGTRPDDLSGRIAWCPQEAHIFRSTVRGNLALATPELPSDAQMFAALTGAGLGEWADSDGLDLWVGDHGNEISGGQRQRLAVARTLLSGADVIVLDEPTAHLDEETATALMDDLRASLESRAVVMVTHDLSLVSDADRVIELGTKQLQPH